MGRRAGTACVLALIAAGSFAGGAHVAQAAGPTERPAHDAEGPAGSGQAPNPSGPPPASSADETSDRLRISATLLAGYGHDAANAPLGFEKQGRVGYAIVTLEGRLGRRVSYRLAINPVNEVGPRPACGEAGFFYPNDPAVLYAAGPVVPCDPAEGTRRVDLYRGIALDVIQQQGGLREAFVDFDVLPSLRLRFGRFVLPIGFDWEQAGALTAKDATLIQRVNAEANFGLQFRVVRRGGDGRAWLTATAAAVQGDGNRWKDYDYFYFQGASLDSNSALAAAASASIAPIAALDLRASFKGGYTGSKVERLPSYWASKRNDHATVFSASYRPIRAVRILGEWARYTWGPTATSAEMLGIDDRPVIKAGGYLTAEVSHPITPAVSLGGSVTYERLDRADSLVRFLAEDGALGVSEGHDDRMSVVRLFADSGRVRVGWYFNAVRNPFPWISGIYPISGPNAFTGRSLERWGIAVRIALEQRQP